MLSAILIVGTDAVGPTMVLALLFLPAGTIMPWVRRLPSAMVGAVLLGWAFLAAGVALSVHMEWPLSHSVGAVGFAAAAVSNLAASARP
jgi:ABC-type Mn2+/Zn2+ transport system permease subunit